ncbi:MAG: hypothetical protein E7773_11265 [Sphingomonas sp.]|uniref:hypothetical protein n=1 Tax=Sphingomonas sp. TaxID=28214 RepID=UPI00120010F1|nr:hypothetical protein [Sphingomonas sp.]THD35039.1 MAG: hypothetical protein E7773_11265 [Sphingomonas sp.]
MKTMLLFATVAALAACAPKTENKTDSVNMVTTTENTTTEAATTNTTAAWTGFEPGTYAVTDAKGDKMEVTINADGTYSGTDPAGKPETGTFVMKGAKGCFTAKGAKEMCYTNSAPAADGSWTGTGDDGSKATVMKKPA